MDKRRSQRLKAVLPIKIFSKDISGTSYCDIGHTLDVGRAGARLGAVHRQIEVGCPVVLQYQHRKAEFRVVWVKSLKGQKEQWIGVTSVEQVNVPWGISSPTPLVSQPGNTRAGSFTQAENKEPLSPRLRRARAIMKTTGCVCQPGSEDVVTIVNMSREGLCFQSIREYVPETLIRVAAPYTPTGAFNIFMMARIAWVRKSATQMNEYGIEYVKIYSSDEGRDENWPTCGSSLLASVR